MDQDKNMTPTLTLTPFEQTAEETPLPVLKQAVPVDTEQPPLTLEEQRMVDEFAKKIDITNTTVVLQYGADAQQKMANFSQGALQNVRAKDLGAVGEMLSTLVVELKRFDADEEKGFLGIFKKAGNKIQALKARYDKAETNVDKIVEVLEQHQAQLFKDIAVLEQMYEQNLVFFKELTMYILAGKKKLNETRETALAAALEKARTSGLPEDAQAANDLDAICNRFEKKLHDLELTRVVSIQMGPQIRLVQNNDSMMAEKIQTTLVNTIPLWKSQMVIAMGLAHSQDAIMAQRKVSDMTNALLKKNAENLKQGTIDAATESERAIVDIETLQYTNQALMDTLDEVLNIQREGRDRRAAAEGELVRIEGELKQKLLELRG